MKSHRILISAAVLFLSMRVDPAPSQSPPGDPRSEEKPSPAALQKATAAFQALGGNRSKRAILHPAMDAPFFFLPHTTTDDALKKLPAVPFSFGLDLRISGITDQGLSRLADTPNLSCLDLVAVKEITDAGLKHLERCKNLRYLNVSFNEKLSDVGMTNLTGCKKLEALCFEDASVTDLGLKELERFPDLEFLEIGNSRKDLPKVTDEGFKALSRCKKLTHLNVMDARATVAGLRELSNLENLRTLFFFYGQCFDDAAAREIGKFKHLRQLGLYLSPKLTDEGVKELANLKGLEVLYLAGTKITDASVDTLSELKQLRKLGLTETALTDKAIFRLRLALPNCEIQRPRVANAKGKV